MKTKKQKKRRAKLMGTINNIKSKFGWSQSSKVHANAKRLNEALDQEEDYYTECGICGGDASICDGC